MIKKLTSLVAVLAVVVFLALPKESQAFGIGAYIPFGAGSGTLTFTDYDYGDMEFDRDISNPGGLGIVLDTRLARNGLFNYRLNLGFINGTFTNPDNPDFEDDGYKYYVIDNSFGFGVVRTSFLRLWVGPQVRLALLAKSEEDEGYTTTMAAFGFGLAPVIGANFNIGRLFTIGLDMGYRFSSYVGTIEFSDDWGDSDSNDFTMSDQVFFVNLSFMFRIGDVFESDYGDYKEDKPNYDEEYY